MSEKHWKGSWRPACIAVLAIFAMSRAGLAGINTWTELGSETLPAGEDVWGLFVDPDDPAILYAGTLAGLYRSSDGGFRWALLSSQFLVEIIRSPHDPQVFYGHDSVRVWKSVDGGISWSGPLNPGIDAPAFQMVTGLALLGGERVMAVGIAGRIFGFGPFIDVSTDDGRTWTRKLGPGSHAHRLVVDPRRNGTLFIGGEGIYRSMDGGETWEESLAPFVPEGVRFVSALAIAPSHPQVIYAGAQDFGESTPERLWKSTDGGETWSVPSRRLDGDDIRDLVVSPESADVVYASVGEPGFPPVRGRVYKSRDGAATWELVGGDEVTAGGELVLHPLFPRTLFTQERRGVFKLTQSAADGCAPGEALCLNGNRFHVEAAWRDFQGQRGRGRAVPLTEDSGYLWFFDPDNVELVVKALDGRGFNDHFWVFYGSLSNVGYTVQVTDVVHERVRTYRNPPESFASVGDVAAFPVLDGDAFTLPATRLGTGGSNGPCVADPTVLCVGDRFELSMSWRDFNGRTGRGMAVGLTADSGYFWFFSPRNVEVVVKVLDGRASNGYFWVFFASLSNVEFSLEVTDRESGDSRRYFNPLGTFASVGDVEALP